MTIIIARVRNSPSVKIALRKIGTLGTRPLGGSTVDSSAVFGRHIPNTHRRRRRDSTVELSCVGVGGVY